MKWRIAQDGTTWTVYFGEEVKAQRPSAHEALAAMVEMMPQAETPADNSGRFAGPIAFEGVNTSDGRYIEHDALTWRTPPLPLMLQTATDVGHFGAVIAGRINSIARQDGGVIWGEGEFDAGEDGQRAAQLVRDKTMRGVSIDPAAVVSEFEVTEFDEDGWPTNGIDKFLEAEIMGATLTPFPAFADARIDTLADNPAPTVPPHEFKDANGDGKCDVCGMVEGEHQDMAPAEKPAAVAAAAAPVRPPAAWFQDPEFNGPSALTVTEDGRVLGHLALFHECHIGMSSQGCIEAAPSPTGYAYFRTGEIETDDGRVAVGSITMDTGHAEHRRPVPVRDVLAHYDNTGTVVADVAAGHDAHGIWVAGALRPSVDDEQKRALCASALSGDWRRIGGSLELVAALAVNVPGFPVPRLLMASGQPEALVAAGHARALDPLSEQEEWRQAIEARMQRLEMRTNGLQPLAADAIRKRLRG